MQVAFAPQARNEMAEAALYYERKQRGPGSEYTQEVYAFVQMVAIAPEQLRILDRKEFLNPPQNNRGSSEVIAITTGLG